MCYSSGMSENISPQIYDLLKETCPLECDIAGDSVVRDISAGMGPEDFEEAEGGARLDFKTVIEVLASMATFLTALLQLRNEWRSERTEDIESRVRDLESRYVGLSD